MKNIPFSQDKVNNIITLYKQGYNQIQIAKYYNTYNTSIRRILLKNNIKIRPYANVNRGCKNNPFKNKDEYSEYFLGLLLTDGCIRTGQKININLSLTETDKYIIEEFKKWSKSSNKISKEFQKLNSSYMYSFDINNKEAVDWLRLKGNFYNKSKYCKLYIPITWNILRGIFDGDGGWHIINHNKGISFFICGASKVFMNQIIYFLEKYNFHPKLRICLRNNNEFYYVEIYKQNDIKNLGNYLYKNAHIFIKRKYEKWLGFYENKSYKDTLNSGKEMAI